MSFTGDSPQKIIHVENKPFENAGSLFVWNMCAYPNGCNRRSTSAFLIVAFS